MGIYIREIECVWVYVCVCVREREKKGGRGRGILKVCREFALKPKV